MGLESCQLFSGPFAQNLTGLYQDVRHTVVLTQYTFPGPVRLLVEFSSLGLENEVPAVLMAVSQELLSSPRNHLRA